VRLGRLGIQGLFIKSADLRVFLRVAIVLAVVVALVVVELSSRSGVLWRLVTFTYQANVLAAAYYTWSLMSPRADARTGLRGAVVLYVVVAGVIWNLFLTGHSMGYTPANVILHVVVPLLAVADWLLIGRADGAVRWWQPLAWLVYPAAYAGLALLVLNQAGRRAPYYFLDPGSVGIATVVANTSILGLGFLGLGYLLLALARRPSANA
jgi:hypothetical protein